MRSTLEEAAVRLAHLVRNPSDGVIMDAVNAISEARYPGGEARRCACRAVAHAIEASSVVICARVRQLMQEEVDS